MYRAVLSFTNYNARRLSQVPYIWVQGSLALAVRTYLLIDIHRGTIWVLKLDPKSGDLNCGRPRSGAHDASMKVGGNAYCSPSLRPPKLAQGVSKYPIALIKSVFNVADMMHGGQS